jgi:aminoglycoside phosphotransferase family enzyme
MNREQEQNLRQADEAIRTVESISRERDLKGNANVTAGRYGELVAKMVKYAESQMALEMLNQGETVSTTASLYQGPEAQSLPSRQHVEPESLRGQNVINPT